MSKYSRDGLRQMACVTISALDDGDPRGLQVVIRLVKETGLPPADVIERIEALAMGEVDLHV